MLKTCHHMYMKNILYHFLSCLISNLTDNILAGYDFSKWETKVFHCCFLFRMQRKRSVHELNVFLFIHFCERNSITTTLSTILFSQTSNSGVLQLMNPICFGSKIVSLGVKVEKLRDSRQFLDNYMNTADLSVHSLPYS